MEIQTHMSDLILNQIPGTISNLLQEIEGRIQLLLQMLGSEWLEPQFHREIKTRRPWKNQ